MAPKGTHNTIYHVFEALFLILKHYFFFYNKLSLLHSSLFFRVLTNNSMLDKVQLLVNRYELSFGSKRFFVI